MKKLPILQNSRNLKTEKSSIKYAFCQLRNSFLAAAMSLFCFTGLYAQNSDEVKTLFSGNSKIKTGFMLEPGFEYSRLGNADVASFQLRGGVVFNSRLSIGGYYAASVNELRPSDFILPGYYLDYRAGGGFVEYTLFSGKLVHATFPLMIGYAEIQADDDFDSDFPDLSAETNFLLIQPGARLELNINKFIRLNAGISYRYAGSFSYFGINQTDFNGLTGNLGLKIGIF